MRLSSSAIITGVRPHGETAIIARMLTKQAGQVAAYVAGGRGRHLGPVLIPGNAVAAELRARSSGAMFSARIELTTSRAPWLSEPLPAAAINWVTALTAATLPERQPYPSLYNALSAVLDAICHAPSARGWLPGLLSYEALLLRDLGYGEYPFDREADFEALMQDFLRLERAVSRYLLADSRTDVMAARAALGARLERMVT